MWRGGQVPEEGEQGQMPPLVPLLVPTIQEEGKTIVYCVNLSSDWF